MAAPKQIKINNKVFKSIAEACRFYNINKSVVKFRLKNKWSIEEAFTTEVKDKTIKISEHTFKNLSEACRYYKRKIHVVQDRLKRGWTLEEALLLDKINKEIQFNVDGKNFTCLTQMCIHYNLHVTSVKRRLDRGWTVQEALGLVKRKGSTQCEGKIYRIKNVVNGKRYIGFTTDTLRNRFYKHVGAAKAGSSTRFHKAIRKWGEYSFNIKLLKTTSNRYDLPELEIYYIKKYDTTIKGYNSIKGGNGNVGDSYGKPIVYQSTKFISHVALAKYLGIEVCTLHNRIKNNIPLDKQVRGR